jgi:gamma-glutamyl hercynylcysteine S-oxide synthase
MHTTGLAAEPIERLYEGDRLGVALADARRRTLAVYSHLDLASLVVPCIPIVNPPLWELAHVAWFQEFWCLRDGGLKPSILGGADALFNSTTVAHDTRWTLAYPSMASLFAYMRDSHDAVQEALAGMREDDRYFFKLALLHEEMHAEALLMTLQTLGLPAPAGESLDAPRVDEGARDIHFAGGEFVQGTELAQFSFDNERGAHSVKVAPFAMSSRTVTQGEYAAFVEQSGRAPPRYWKREGSSWLARRFDRWLPVDAQEPMIHVSLAEAAAYADWAARRLPTESEWEFAARDAAGSGLRQMMGGVWEWTSSVFAPYPGFTPDPYREYSEPWFHTHHVLRGGSFATSSRIAYERYRNFYLPERADMFVGFRTCALEAGQAL